MSFQPLAGISWGDAASRPRPCSRSAPFAEGAAFDGALSCCRVARGTAPPGTRSERLDPRPVTSLTRARPRMAPRAGKREEVGRADMLGCLGARVSGQRLRPVPVQQPETDIYAQPPSIADRSLRQGR